MRPITGRDAEERPLRRTLAQLTRGVGRVERHRRNGSIAPLPDYETKLGHLRETEVFAPLSPAERTWLAENTAMLTYERGHVFYDPSETAEVVFILKRGKVELYRLAGEGRKIVVASLGPHTIFGEMGLIGQRMHHCFAEAVDECLICVLRRRDLETLVRRNPEVGLRLLADLGRRLEEREADLAALAFATVPTRLATLLLREADGYGTVSGYSHQELADRLGIYRETVSQVLARFRNEGLVSVEPRRIRLLDRHRLESYSRT